MQDSCDTQHRGLLEALNGLLPALTCCHEARRYLLEVGARPAHPKGSSEVSRFSLPLGHYAIKQRARVRTGTLRRE